MMIQTLILFSLLNSIWILVFKFFGPLARKMIYKETVEEKDAASKMEIFIDIIFFSFAANGFYFSFSKLFRLI